MASAVLPSGLKPISSFLKLAKEYDKRDPTISYFCRLYAVERGIKIDSKTPDCKMYLIKLMDDIEKEKKSLLAKGDEAMGNDLVAQAHVENTAINLFFWADGEDRKGIYNKSITKAFYSASLLFDVLSQFEELSDQCKVQQRYAKWKATYLHKCMQTGETPIPGPEGSGFEDDLNLNPYGDTASTSHAGPPNTFEPGSSQSAGFSYMQPIVHLKPTPALRQPPAPNIPSSYVELQEDSADNSDIDFSEASKLCKYAMSALQYEDVDTAVVNLTKALNLLKKGE